MCAQCAGEKMCGIAGLIKSRFTKDESLAIAKKMGHAIAHRGPDDQGIWNDSHGNYLVHRRLSILDLSPAGHQPMISQNSRFILVFNGEIYNYKDLRENLIAQGVSFRGASDTEVLLEMISREGVANTLSALTGMFALAVWDQETQKLYLSRDRMGEKPLYYGWHEGQFLFASELKSLQQVPGFSPGLDLHAMGLFFKYNYIPAPHCIFQGVFKLPQAHWAEVNCASQSGQQEVTLHAYWTYPKPLTDRENLNYTRSLPEVTEEFHELLKASIGRQMHSDVPLGSFLSGGLDSSLVTSLMQAQSSKPIRTFTIGFHEKDYDESPYAREIADHLKCQHTEWIVSAGEIKSLIPEIPRIYDEPFSDSSQLPTCLLAQMTAKEVTVALSGDGGDELFGGYYRYLWTEKIWNKMGPMPLWLRKFSAKMISSRPEDSWQNLYDLMKKILPLPAIDSFGHKIKKMANMLPAANALEAYDLLISHWYQPRSILSSEAATSSSAISRPTFLANRSVVANMMWLDSQNYLPDDLMVKVDRGTMASSLESRAPFLDHQLIEFVSQLPLQFKLQQQQSKILMRSVLGKYIPLAMIDRPKKGFSVPINQWLREDLKPWADDLLAKENMSHGYLNYTEIDKRWREHKSGQHNWGLHLWDVLVFQMWYHHNKLGVS
jgi:asparagine synthase (glutamine-hydrolysing)